MKTSFKRGRQYGNVSAVRDPFTPPTCTPYPMTRHEAEAIACECLEMVLNFEADWLTPETIARYEHADRILNKPRGRL